MNSPSKHIDEEKLYQDVSHLIETTQQQVLHKVSHAGVMLYWHIGTRINKEVLVFDRAAYGKQVINSLAKKLQIKYGKGYSPSTIYRCVQFSKSFDNEVIVYALGAHLKWTHFINL